jgi:NitT/TauT family transport system permease protein
MHPRNQATIIRVTLVVLVMALLEGGCRTGIIPQITMVPPSSMLVAAFKALTDPRLEQSMLITLQEVVISAVLAVVAGIIIALCLFAVRPIRQFADPVLNAWYAVPIFIFYPVMIVFFGIGERSIIAISFIFSVAAMILSALAALDRIPAVLFKVSQLHQLGPARSVLFILLPSALPHLVVGLRLVLAYSLIATIAAEFILSGAGIGHEISFAYDNFQTGQMYGLILIVIVAAVLLNTALSAMVRHLGGQDQVKGGSGG